MSFKITFACSLLLLAGCNSDGALPHIQPEVTMVTVPIEVTHRVPSKTFYSRIEGGDSLEMAMFSRVRVENLQVRAGEFVVKGQVLATLYSPDLLAKLDEKHAALNSAQANLTLARAQSERSNTLLAQGLVSQANVDESYAALKVAEQDVSQAFAKLQAAKNMQIDLQLTAKSAGVVSDIYFRQGDYVNPGEPIVQLQTNNTLKVRFQLPERDALNLKLKQRVHMFIPSTQQHVEGEVIERTLPLNENSPFFDVFVELNNTEPSLIGLRAMLMLPLTDKPLYEVPASAVRYDITNHPYLLLGKDAVEKVSIELIATSSTHVLVSAEKPLEQQSIVTSEAKLALNLVNGV